MWPRFMRRRKRWKRTLSPNSGQGAQSRARRCAFGESARRRQSHSFRGCGEKPPSSEESSRMKSHFPGYRVARMRCCRQQAAFGELSRLPPNAPKSGTPGLRLCAGKSGLGQLRRPLPSVLLACKPPSFWVSPPETPLLSAFHTNKPPSFSGRAQQSTWLLPFGPASPLPYLLQPSIVPFLLGFLHNKPFLPSQHLPTTFWPSKPPSVRVSACQAPFIPALGLQSPPLYSAFIPSVPFSFGVLAPASPIGFPFLEKEIFAKTQLSSKREDIFRHKIPPYHQNITPFPPPNTICLLQKFLLFRRKVV